MKLLNLFRWPTARDRFAQAVMQRARERKWPHPIQYDRDDFRLDIGIKDAKFFLTNTFNEWRNTEPGARSGEIDRLIDAMFESVANELDLDTALPLLLPIVRNRRELECYWLHASTGLERNLWNGAYRPLCDSFAVAVAIDRPASLMSLDSRQIGIFDVPFSTLLERAVLNLREKSVVSFERDPGGFYVSQYNDLYDCSRLLVPHLFDLLSLNGNPVAVPLARNGLVVAGSKDVGALLAMAQFVEQRIETATRPIGYMPIILRDGEWRTFDLPETELGPLRELVAKQRLWDYEIQREMIEAHFHKIQRDVYVGKLDAINFEGRIVSYTTWGRNVLTLLPQAEVVAIALDRDGLALLRKWDDFFSVCGEHLTDEGFYPKRYRTPPTISEDHLQRLERDFSIPEWWPPEREGVRHFK